MMCAPLSCRVSPDTHTHTCHHLFFAGGPANRAWWAASRACISASTRAVIILQPHPSAARAWTCNCNCRCGHHPASLERGLNLDMS